MAVPMKISDGRREAHIDLTTNSFVVIDHEHHEIHEGENYRATAMASIGSGNTFSLTITTPAAPKQCHLLIHASSGNSSNVAFYEGVTVTANTGNAVTARNANRNYADGSTSVLERATINTTNVPVIFSTMIGSPGATPANPDTGGSEESRHEWILKPGTKYSLVMTETAAVTQLMSITFDWYEHSPNGDA